MLFAEESLFSWVSTEEGYLASLGMTTILVFSAIHEAGATKTIHPITT